ncbi:MAG: hypothetical protein MOB07_16010 [Acidobacteria bacterium]|nr:hypothetical protein [Acidobacteriota bacterium]
MMTKEEALLFKSRWRLANERIAQEIRKTSVLTKLHQLALMFAAGEALGWSERMREGEEEIYERWQRLRERMNGG